MTHPTGAGPSYGTHQLTKAAPSAFNSLRQLCKTQAATAANELQAGAATSGALVIKLKHQERNMSGALSSVMGGVMGGGDKGGGILGTIGGVVGSVFGGPIGGMIGSAVGNMVQGAVGDATKQAAEQLHKESGMPKFLVDEIKQVVKDAVAECRNNDVDPATQHHVDNDSDMQSWKKSFTEDLCKGMVENCRKHMEANDEASGGGDAKKGGKKSWLQAMASAMGSTLGQKASKLVELSNKMSTLSDAKTQMAGERKEGQQASGKEEANAAEFTKTQTELQAVSQEFSLLQSAFSNALKSIGEGLSQMGRKG